MANVDEVSELLLGRYQALRAYLAIARRPKPEFTTGEITTLTGVPGPALSKEFKRLRDLGVLRGTSRRGDYERVDEPAFWGAIQQLAEWADSTG